MNKINVNHQSQGVTAKTSRTLDVKKKKKKSTDFKREFNKKWTQSPVNKYFLKDIKGQLKIELSHLVVTQSPSKKRHYIPNLLMPVSSRIEKRNHWFHLEAFSR